MQSSFISKFTSGFFWFGFCVFLGASIPHIAAFYRHFDPNATPGSIQDITDWVIGYLIAIVIDVTDVLVSIAVLKALNSGARKRDLIGYWSFILFVMSLSWLVNWQYDIVYQTNAFAKAENIAIFGVLVGAVNPVIGSAFQLLLLVYTEMAHKFAEKPVQKTAEQLRQEADELEQVAMQQARIDAVKKMQNDNKVGGLIDSLGQAKERAKQLFNGQVSEPTTGPIVNLNAVEEVNSQQPSFDDENEQDQDTDKMPVVNIATVRKTRNSRTTKQAASRIRKALLANPDLTLSELVKKTKVSRSYASQIRSQVLSEQSEVRA